MLASARQRVSYREVKERVACRRILRLVGLKLRGAAVEPPIIPTWKTETMD